MILNEKKLKKLNFVKRKIEFALVDITNVCNYSCKFCWYFSNPKKQWYRTIKDRPFFFPAAKLIELIKDLNKIKVKKLCITSEGEPTLHPQLSDIAQALAKTRIRFNIETNGTFNEKLRKAMLLFDELCINLSCLSEDVFEKTMNPGIKFQNDKVLDNISFLKRHKKKPKITIVYILSKYNLCELDTIIEQFNKMGIDELRFKIFELSPFLNEDLIFSREEAKIAALKLLSQRKRCQFKNNIFTTAQVLIKDYQGPEVLGNNPKIEDADFSWTEWKEKAPQLPECETDFIQATPDLKRCLSPLSYLYLRLNGNIYSCPRNDWIEPIGNIFERDIKDILNSRAYWSVVYEHLFNFDINKPKWRRCRNCPLLLNIEGKYSYDYITGEVERMS
ncbi:MAG: radical SAM protein [Candidatus Omnitrophica bacterium]|nr:radical SAM protein [Candidatus Omnitrophota bacterium]